MSLRWLQLPFSHIPNSASEPLLLALTLPLLDGIGFAGTHDPDEMIGKLRMHLGNIVLGRVTGGAFGRGFGTDLR